ncbi:iron transporter [Halopiger djelfimassiliensis]|uniref:iron transporter n=1 Tax=Halopiger djelfimassiliensis TaxID=1293047 RepID=UPI0006782DA0|nr:iron transporter [Halopiger djelfimassiliensis]
MNRRGVLRGTAVAGVVGVAGCLERLGFTEESAWANPPIVDGRPDAVYLPAGTEEMAMYGTATDGEYGVALTYTIPHRFWVLAGEDSQVDVTPDDSLHLMLTVWDVETATVLPVDVSLELFRDGDRATDVGRPWPMISQRMGFHYGDNVSLPGEGEYTARIRVGPVDAERTGALEGRLDAATTLEIDFEFVRSDVHDLDFDLVDEDRRGERDALPLMDHGHGGGDHGSGGDHPPTAQGRPIADLPGTHIGTERSGDAAVSALRLDDEASRLTDAESYLAVPVRTPYNDIVLPFATLHVTVERDGAVVHESSLTETVDHELGHHYGTGIDDLRDGDELTIAVDSPPQVSRHDGYETAFLEFEDVTVTVR